MALLEETTQQRRFHNLHREWLIYALASVLLIAGGFLVLRQTWPILDALAWLGVSSGLVVYLFVYLWNHLSSNRPNDAPAEALFPSLGVGNGLTIIRAVFTSALAGFLFGPRPQGWLAWAPGALYLTSAVLDYLDGYAARVTRHPTLLGEALDMKWDTVAMVIATALTVLYEQTPVFYLWVGLARYLYLFGLWVRGKRGLAVYELPPDRFRRVVAGTQMGFVAAVLLPILRPPVTWLAAGVFMLPHLVGFTRDYLAVTGHTMQKNARWLRFSASVQAALTLGLRALLVALLANLAITQGGRGSLAIGILIAAGLAIPAFLLGAAGRVVALALLVAAALSLQSAWFEWRYWLVFLCSAVLFLTGTGQYSLWKPEDWLIDHRAGEA